MDIDAIKALIEQSNKRLLDEIKKLLTDNRKEMMDAINARTMELIVIITGLEARINKLTAQYEMAMQNNEDSDDE